MEEEVKKPLFKKVLPWIVVGALLIVTIIVLIVLNIKRSDEIAGTTTGEIVESLDIDNGDQKIDWSLYPTYDVKLSESYTISTSGTYNLTGQISDGLISVNANDKVVRLVLNGVTITNHSGPAIYVENAKDVVVELAEGSTNTLADGAAYSDVEEDVDGAIFSKDDLTFQGTGKLIIKANYLDGIVSKDDLKIINGEYQISSVDDGIRGKDSVYILNGN